MKRTVLLLLVASLTVSFSACSLREDPSVKETHNASTVNTTVAQEATTATTAESTAETQATTQATVATTEAQQTEATEEIRYSVKIRRADFPIFSGPSYDFSPAGTVEEAGVYTVVEEATDGEGNLWGKLKSGLGWIDLSLNEKEKQNMPPVTVSLATSKLLDSGNYYYCKADTSSYAFDIAFLSHGALRDVSFFAINTAHAYTRGPELFRISSWDADKPFVVRVSFPGAASLYGLEFTDSRGVTHIYSVWQSGRNGSVGVSIFTELLEPAEPAIPESLDMVFSSGAGAWGTELTLYSDGTFLGMHSDSDMGSTGEGYPNGTRYVCEFDGAFCIVGTSEYALTLELKELNTVDYGAEEWIEDGLRYIASSAYGIADGSSFLLYMPNTPVSEIPEAMRYWAFKIPQTGILGRYALYCPETECAFFSY